MIAAIPVEDACALSGGVRLRSVGKMDRDRSDDTRETDDDHKATLEALGQACGKLGHDFNNLFAAVQGCLEVMELRMTKEFPSGAHPLQRQFLLLRTTVERGVRLTNQIRAFVRPGPLEKSRVHVKNLVELLQDLLAQTKIAPCEIEVIVTADPLVYIQEFTVTQMLTALCINAIEAMSAVEGIFCPFR